MSGNIEYSFESYVNLPTDITFVIHESGIRKSLLAHKYFLAKVSPVFRALLYNNWKEDQDDNEEIKINTNYDVFKTVLDYIYTDNLSIKDKTKEEIQEIMKISDWYHLPMPKAKCRDALLKMDKTCPLPNHFLSQIPTDVEFVLEEDGSKETVKAHKYLLAQKSSVFNAMLFGPLQESKVDIQGTSLKMFKILIAFMYEEPLNIMGLELCQQFEIYNLGEMYDVVGLKNRATAAMNEKEITKENVMEVASEAERYSHIFKEVSESLFKRCVRFVSKEVLHSKKDFVTFSKAYMNGPLAATAMKLMASLPDCNNCLQTPCVTGSLMQLEDIKKGTRVSSYNDSIVGQVAYIMSKDDIGVHGDDGKMYKFCFDLPPRDIDIVLNPTYHHQFYLGSNGRVFGGSGVARGGIYWHCSPLIRPYQDVKYFNINI